MRPARLLPCLCVLCVAVGLARSPASPAAEAAAATPTAADAAFRGLLEALEERRMPDVMLWAVESADGDPTLSDAARAELPFLRATALVALSRVEADPQKRSRLLDEAEASIDGFLSKSPAGDGLIAALSQKANLLVERGRGKLAQAARPGADATRLKAEAVAFFDEALAALASPTAKGGEQGGPAAAAGSAPTNAEDAVLRDLRAVDGEIVRIREPVAEIRGRVAAKEKEIRPVAETVDGFEREIHKLEVEQAALESRVAASRREIQQLRLPPQPQRGDERKDARLLKKELEGRMRENLARATSLEQELPALQQQFKVLEEQRRRTLGEKRKSDGELTRLKREKMALDRELDAAEKPLEDQLAPQLRAQEALRVKLLQARFLAAETHFEKSRAFDPSTPEWKAAMEASTAGHRALVEKYGKMGVAYMARLNQGRNEAELGNHAAALVTLAPLYSLEAAPGQPISPLGMGLKTRALALALESWAATKEYLAVTGPEPFDAGEYRKNALLKFALASAKGGRPDADLAAVKYRTAVLLDARAAEIAAQNSQAANLLREDALRLAREVARGGKEYARESRDLAARLGKDLPDVAVDDFETLVSDARAAVTAIQEQTLEVKRLQAAGQAAEATQAAEQAAADRDRAIGLFEKAIAKAREGSAQAAANVPADSATVSDLRATLAFLFYDAKRFDEAVAIGADLVEHHPNAMGSRKAATVALASLQDQSRQGDDAARRTAKERLATLARLMVKTWPAEVEGSEAFSILVAEALESRDPETIRRMIAGIPAAATRRPEFAMRLGIALRREAREAARAESAGRPADAELAAWNTAAAAAIDEGLAAVEKAGSLPADSSGKVAVAAAVARAQMALEVEDFPQVERLLNHPVYGPLKLANGNDPAFAQGPLADGARTIALRYFVETERPDEARDVLAAMEKAAGDGADSSAKLVNNFLAISRDLQAQLDALMSGPRSGSPEAQRQALKILDGFETVLEGLRNRDRKFTTQFFVADTYCSLGTSKALETALSKAKADDFLARSADGFTRLLARKDDAEASAEDRAEIARFEPTIRRRLVTILKRQSAWDEAQAQLDWILADPQRQNSLDVQLEAAELLEAAGRAAAATDPAKADALLREAATGRKTDTVQIWGWGGIANKLSRQAFASADQAALKSRERFYEARIRVAQTLLARARLPDQQDREKRLETAKSAIVMTRKLYPDLGGPALRRRFEAVLEEIQRDQGAANPGGFNQLDQESGAATAAAAP